MLFSLIVPVYNVAPYLREALDSVVNQTYKDLEIFIVDDGSTDGSASICEEYAASDYRIELVHQPNKGLSGARNTGLRIATGDFVSFVDSDDSVSPVFVESLVNAIVSSSIAICRLSSIDTSGNMSGVAATSVFPTIKAGVFEREDALRALVDERMSVNVCNKLFRRELWSDIRFLEGHVYEDALPEFKLFDKSERVVLLDEALYNYRQRTDSIASSVSMDKINDCILAHYSVSEFIKSSLSSVIPEPLFLKKHQRLLSFLIVSYIKLVKISSKDITLERELRTNDYKGQEGSGDGYSGAKGKVIFLRNQTVSVGNEYISFYPLKDIIQSVRSAQNDYCIYAQYLRVPLQPGNIKLFRL